MIKLNASSDFYPLLWVLSHYKDMSNATSNALWRMVSAPIVGGDFGMITMTNLFIVGFSSGVGNFSLANCGGFCSVYTYNESLAGSSPQSMDFKQ